MTYSPMARLLHTIPLHSGESDVDAMVFQLWDRIFPSSRLRSPETVLGAQEISTIVNPYGNMPWAQIDKFCKPENPESRAQAPSSGSSSREERHSGSTIASSPWAGAP